MKRILVLAIIIFGCKHIEAQQLAVNVSAIGDKVKVEWKNPYGDSIVQLNIQRSWDSLKFFQTIFVPLSPELPQNGYVDDKAGYTGMYYRAFYVLANGSFFFTKAKKPITGADFTDDISEKEKIDTNFLVTIHDEDTVIAQLNYTAYKRFKDSIIHFTSDTLYSLTDADVMIKYYGSGANWVPSKTIFTNTDGYVQVYLPDALTVNYRLRIMNENRKTLFNIPHITQPILLLDKTNFLHAGWFYFELFQNDKIKERNKFYVPKDF